MFNHSLRVLAIVALPVVAHAQSAATCDIDDVAFEATKAALAGSWTVTNKVGVMKLNGRHIPLPPPTQSETITLSMDGDKLMAVNSVLNSKFEVQYYDGPDWDLSPTPDIPVSASDILTDEDLSLAAGCDANDLLRVTGSGQARDPGSGVMVDFSVHLFVLSDRTMYGVTKGKVQTSQGPGEATRIMVMTR